MRGGLTAASAGTGRGDPEGAVAFPDSYSQRTLKKARKAQQTFAALQKMVEGVSSQILECEADQAGGVARSSAVNRWDARMPDGMAMPLNLLSMTVPSLGSGGT